MKGKRKRSGEALGDLVLVPKQVKASAVAPLAGFKIAHGTKQAVKSGYRGVRQRPWGALRCSPGAQGGGGTWARGGGWRGRPSRLGLHTPSPVRCA